MGRHAAQRPARLRRSADSAAALAWLAGMLTAVAVTVAAGYAARLARRLGRHAWHLVCMAWRRLGVRGRLEAGIVAAFPVAEAATGTGLLPGGQFGAFSVATLAAGACWLARSVIRREAQSQWRDRRPPHVVTGAQLPPGPIAADLEMIWRELRERQATLDRFGERLDAQDEAWTTWRAANGITRPDLKVIRGG